MTRDELRLQYQRLLGEGREPLESQLDAAEIMQKSGRLLAVLPTGAAKTLLAALPSAADILHTSQMIFMTPLRSLASAQAIALREQVHPLDGSSFDVREQTGTFADDPLFCARATVTTFDQALSSALQIAYSASKSRRTINAGAILTSYLVADELHLFPRDQALTTLLWLLRNRPDLPFLLMTATLTPSVVAHLADLLHAEILSTLGDLDRVRLGIHNRIRRVRWCPNPISPDEILSAVAEGRERVLVVVNTVGRAIELGNALREPLKAVGVRVLHSRFYPDDRKRIEEEIRQGFGKTRGSTGPRVIIATQVVEVGLDISADLLLTEVAPANALVQRFGRSARWGGVADIQVHPPPGGESGRIPPYIGEGQRDVVERTVAWLKAEAASVIMLDDATEQSFLDAAHREDDEAWLAQLKPRLAQRTSRIGEVSGRGEYAAAGELIRSVEQRTVLVHGRPEEIPRPLSARGFSLSVGQLYGMLTGTAEPNADADDEFMSFDLPPEIPWRLKEPIWPEREVGERSADIPVGWQDVTAERMRYAPLVAVNPAIVTYDPFAGLQLVATGGAEEQYWASEVQTAGKHRAYSAYRSETFAEHVERMLRVYQHDPALGPRLAAVASLVEDFAGWPPGMLDRVVRAAIVLHDTGKLAPVWARYIRDYQRKGSNSVRPWLVHSDDPRPGAPPGPWAPPPHALAGAAHSVGVGRTLDRDVEAWHAARAAAQPGARPSVVLFSAIATHHSPSLSKLVVSASEQLDPPATRQVAEALARHGISGEVRCAAVGKPLDSRMVSYASLGMDDGLREWIALAVVIRVLRLADGWSQEVARWEVNLR